VAAAEVRFRARCAGDTTFTFRHLWASIAPKQLFFTVELTVKNKAIKYEAYVFRHLLVLETIEWE
jgi:hypothetical protein